MKGNNMNRKRKAWFIAVVLFFVYLVVFSFAVWWKQVQDEKSARTEFEMNNYMLAEMLAEKDPKIKEMFDKFINDNKIDADELLILRGHWLKISQEIK